MDESGPPLEVFSAPQPVTPSRKRAKKERTRGAKRDTDTSSDDSSVRIQPQRAAKRARLSKSQGGSDTSSTTGSPNDSGERGFRTTASTVSGSRVSDSGVGTESEWSRSFGARRLIAKLASSVVRVARTQAAFLSVSSSHGRTVCARTKLRCSVIVHVFKTSRLCSASTARSYGTARAKGQLPIRAL